MSSRAARSSIFGATPSMRPVDPDAPIHWGCSGKGWNCCVGKGITIWPFDLLGLGRATGLGARGLINAGRVTFSWYTNGSLVGVLQRRPYAAGGEGTEACIFLEELTNADAAALRQRDPLAFRALPFNVQRSADSTAAEPWRVAGLCQVHAGRPMVCRGFPFARHVSYELRDGALAVDAATPSVQQVHRCGSCALSTATTVRAVLEAEDVRPYWLAWDAFEAVTRYLRGLGLATLKNPTYVGLPVSEHERTELWAGLYVPESHPQVPDRFGERWHQRTPPERDLEIYRLLIERAFETGERLVEEHRGDVALLGHPDEPPVRARPDLDALLDPARELLPPAPGEERATA